MHFNVDALPAESFAQWVDAKRNTGPLLDEEAYAALAKPSKAVAPYTYRTVAADLFSDIVNTASAADSPSQSICSMSQRAER